VFYDHGPDVEGGPPGSPDEEGDRYVEIWNLVFMQFNRDAEGNMTPLPKPSVDTGLGLERLATVLQGVHSNYDIDLFKNLVHAAQDITGAADRHDKSLLVLADHIRSAAFLITDGVIPSNEGRGYVLRRIMRRAIRHGYRLGGKTPFFCDLVRPLVLEMGDAYPELAEAEQRVVNVIETEEQRFAETLEQGMRILDQEVAAMSGKVIPGEVVFRLYDTYGFPADLTADVARERGLSVDMDGFDVAMAAQRDRGRAASQFAAAEAIKVQGAEHTEFTGYATLGDTAVVQAIVQDGTQVQAVEAGAEAIIVLDHTPFYAESGGQVGDSGRLRHGDAVFDVTDTQKLPNAVIGHVGRVRMGRLCVNDSVQAEVDDVSRAATARNHSATHLLHAALKTVLGAHVQQKGSLVEAPRLRFDFSHNEMVSPEQLAQIERLVNEQILTNRAVETRVMQLDEAKAAGAAALFGEKYDERVRVVGMGEFSLELCGGTHVQRTGDIGLFMITSESGIAAGVRRIEAVTGEGAHVYVSNQLHILDRSALLLKSSRDDLEDKVKQALERIKRLEKEKQQLQARLASGAGSDLNERVQQVGDIKVLAARLDGADSAAMRSTIDRFRDRLGEAVVVLGAAEDGKARLAAGVSKALSKRVHAGKLIQHVAAVGGGKGGGRPDMAEGGLPSAESLDQSLDAVLDWVKEQL
jgi:alanyl-tRNA synthetase